MFIWTLKIASAFIRKVPTVRGGGNITRNAVRSKGSTTSFAFIVTNGTKLIISIIFIAIVWATRITSPFLWEIPRIDRAYRKVASDAISSEWATACFTLIIT